ncbi:hypothetical protein BDR26DRAFT_852925, partial [Obelidium mucronatum]
MKQRLPLELRRLCFLPSTAWTLSEAASLVWVSPIPDQAIMPTYVDIDTPPMVLRSQTHFSQTRNKGEWAIARNRA